MQDEPNEKSGLALWIKSNRFYLKFILFGYSAMSENSAADA